MPKRRDKLKRDMDYWVLNDKAKLAVSVIITMVGIFIVILTLEDKLPYPYGLILGVGIAIIGLGSLFVMYPEHQYWPYY